MEVNAIRPRLLRWIPATVIAVLLLWGVKHWAFAAPAPKLLTVPVRIADIEETVLASGVIQPRKLVSVGAQASGRIIAMHVSLGDQVHKGQLIAEIDPEPQQNELRKQEAILAQERAQRTSREVAMKLADLAFKRASVTYAQEASSQADYETAEATYKGTKADVEALDAEIKQAVISVDTARVTLGYTKVIAPMDGTVVAIVAPEGQTVNAVQAAPTIVKLADLETMTVKAQISEADVTRVHPGQKVYFTILGAPQHRYYTTLRALEPAPESLASDTTGSSANSASASNTQNSAIYYNALFDIANPDHELRPSMTAQVSVVLKEAKGATTVPSSALREVRADGRRLLNVQNDSGIVQNRWVLVGIDDNSVAQVLDGLKPGERVVLGSAPAIQALPGAS
jgi:membrane fusion protein, macrolide-specific efflux system